MKIAISTQIRENYGSAEQPYWKCKGGSTYVVPNLTAKQAAVVEDKGIPTLTALIETSSSGFEEYVIGFTVVDDNAKVCDSWETPFELHWTGNRWIANRTIENGEYGYMRYEVLRLTEEYDMAFGGGRENYRAVYTMRNGDVVTGDDMAAYLEKLAA